MSCLINDVEYGWSNVRIFMLGQTLTGVTAIKYAQTQKKENYLGAGAKPVARGRAEITFTGSLTLQTKEVQAIQRALPSGKTLTDIGMFNIEVVYAAEGSPQVKNTLCKCEFTSNSREVKTGDGIIETEFELIIGDIIW